MPGISIPTPPTPTQDLRTQLTNHIVQTAIAGLEKGACRRSDVFTSGDVDAYRTRIVEAVHQAFGPMPCGKLGGPLNRRSVSNFDTRHCRIENVIFESYPGWEVNASVFVPSGKGPHPAVILPVGHSGKQFANYQIPAQAFASLGFLAVLFDPPGQASEKQRGNDHFRDGVRSSLFGLCSNRFFVIDALRCIDYLETRDDVDMAHGVAMSGVSGGGITTLFATLFDKRIACFGPSCCLNELADHPVGDLYSACPENLWHGRLADGIDTVDIALACAPRPMRYMAGAGDEVFLVDATRKLAESVAAGYRAAGAPERFDYFEDDCGHAYTLAQTARFSQWVRRWMLGEQDPSVPSLDPDAFEMLDYAMLQCHPSEETTMFSIHRELAKAARDDRNQRGSDHTAIDGARNTIGPVEPVSEWHESSSLRVWSQGYAEGLYRQNELEVPFTILRPWSPMTSHVNVVFLDDQGRRHALEGHGVAAPLTRMFDRDPDTLFPSLFVPDLPGWGESASLLTPYQTAGWGTMDRIHAYLSYGNADGILAILVRSAAAFISATIEHSNLPAARTVMIGTGMGGVVGLLAAAILESPVHVMTVSSLVAFESLLAEEFYSWPAAAFLPGALKSFDLPDLVHEIRGEHRRVIIIDPRDGAGRPLDETTAATLGRSSEVAESGDQAATPDVYLLPAETPPADSIGDLIAARVDEIASIQT